MRDDVVMLVRYQAAAGRFDEALARIRALVAQVVAGDPECRGIELLVDPEQEAILLLERWSSAGHFFGPHMDAPALRAFIASAGEVLQGPPAISAWRRAAG
jgi:quinol monooxygenase YgiN